jgi:hypothetical protein
MLLAFGAASLRAFSQRCCSLMYATTPSMTSQIAVLLPQLSHALARSFDPRCPLLIDGINGDYE